MTCTNREIMGHGQGAVCGKPYYNEIWLCGKCKLKKLEADLATARQEAIAYRISLENLEAENEKLKKELEEVKYCAEWNQNDLSLANEYKKSLDDLLASLPKIKADAVRDYGAACDSVFYSAYKPTPEEYANKLEAGE